MSLRINRRNSFLEIKEGGSVQIFKDTPRHLRPQIPESNFPYALGYCGDRHYGLYSEPPLHINDQTEFLTSSAVKFNGSQFLESNEISLTGMQEFSISTWVKTETSSEEYIITDLDSEGSGSFFIKSNNLQNRPEFSVYNGVNDFISVTGENAINDGDWHLINVNFKCDKNSKEATIDLYIDSIFQNSQNIDPISDNSLLESTESFDSVKNDIGNITDENNDTYIDLGGNTQVSNIYFGSPITEGIDKIRIRAIPDGGMNATTSYSLLLRHKETKQISTEEFLQFAGGDWKSDVALSTSYGNSYNQTPYPSAIPESGISYGPPSAIFTFGCPTACTQYDNTNKVWFPVQDFNLSSPYTATQTSYPLSSSSARDYERDADGEIITHPTQYVYANFNTWQTEAPFLYGKDFSLSQFSEYDIVGFQHNLSDSVGHVNFSRIIELSLYKDNVKQELFTIDPLDKYSGSRSNKNSFNPLTIGASSLSNKINFFNGCIDQLIISDKTISQDQINTSYSGRNSKSYTKSLADELGVISWYDFANTEIIGWDRHYKKTSQNLIRLYSFNNTRRDSSPHNKMPQKFGDITYSSEVFKFFDKSAFFNGNSYLFDEGGRELSLDSNFTIDCFLNFSSIPADSQQNLLESNEYKKTGVGYNIYFKNDKLFFEIYLGLTRFALIESNSLNISTDIFYHIAICRDRNKIFMFFDRQLCAEAELPYYLPLQNGSEGLYILNKFHGHVQDLRIISQASLYNPNIDIDEQNERLSSDFYERNILTTTSHYPLTEEVAFSDSQGILIPQRHFLNTSNNHKAFNFHKNSFSIFSWFQLENIEKSGFILGSWNDEGGFSHSYAIRYVKNFRGQQNTLSFLVSEDGSNFRAVRAAHLKNNIIRPKKWYFIGVTYNSSTKQLTFYIYDELEFIDSVQISVNQFFTISRRDDFQINGVKNTENANTFLDLSLGQLFFLYKSASSTEVQNFWNYGGGIKYEPHRDLNRDVIAWFDFDKGSTLDLNGSNHLSSSSSFAITEGRQKFELVDDEAEIFVGKSTAGDKLLFNLGENRPKYQKQGINNLPSIEFDKSNSSFLDSNFFLDFSSDFLLYFCFKTSGSNNDFAPIIDFSHSESEGLSVLWKDTPSSQYPGVLKFLINGKELVFKNEPFIQESNVVTIEWNRAKEKLFFTLNNSRLSSAPRVLSQTELHLNFAQAPLSLGKFYYDSDSSQNVFNGLISEIIYDKSMFQAQIQNFLSCKYNTLTPSHSPNYIFDDDIPAIIFDTSEVRETIGENNTHLGKIKCSLANPIYSIVDDNSFTISESGDIHLTDPADIEDIFYTFTILVEDQDSDQSATISLISYVQEDTIVSHINTSLLKSFLTQEESKTEFDIGSVFTTSIIGNNPEPVSWSMEDPFFSINSQGLVTLSNPLPDGTTSISFTVLATDNQDNVTAASHNIRIVDEENISELEFISNSSNPFDLTGITLEFTLDRDQEFIQIDRGSGFETFDSSQNKSFSNSSSNHSTQINTPSSSYGIFEDFDNGFDTSLLKYASYINPVNHESTSASYIDYNSITSNRIFYAQDRILHDSSLWKYIYLFNNSFTPPDENYRNSSTITNTDLAPALKVIENLQHNTDGNPYNTTPPKFNQYSTRRLTITGGGASHIKIRGKFLHLSVEGNNYYLSNLSNRNSGSIKVTANSQSFLQKLSFNRIHLSKLILNCETDQLVDLNNFCEGARFDEIEKINFNTSNVLTAGNAFKDSYINDSCKSFLSSLSFDNLINARSFFKNSNITGSTYLDLSGWNTWNLLLIDNMFEKAYVENNLLSFNNTTDSVNSFNFSNYTNSDVNTNTLLPNPSYISAFKNKLGSTFYTRKVRSANYLFRQYTVSLKSDHSVNPPTTIHRSYLGEDVRIYEGSIVDTESIDFLNDTDLQNTVLDLNCLELPICSELLQAFTQINVEKILLQNLDFKFKTNLLGLFAFSPGLKSINLCNYGDIESRVDESPTNFFSQHSSMAFSLSEMFQNCERLENLDIKFEQGSGTEILTASGHEQYSEFYSSLEKSFMDSLSFLSFPKCIDASKMFRNCHLITHISVPRFKNITTLLQFAENCHSLTNFQGFEKHFREDLDVITSNLKPTAAPPISYSNECNIELTYGQRNNLNLFPEYITFNPTSSLLQMQESSGTSQLEFYGGGIFKRAVPGDVLVRYDSAGEIENTYVSEGDLFYTRITGNPADGDAEPGPNKRILGGVDVSRSEGIEPIFDESSQSHRIVIPVSRLAHGSESFRTSTMTIPINRNSSGLINVSYTRTFGSAWQAGGEMTIESSNINADTKLVLVFTAANTANNQNFNFDQSTNTITVNFPRYANARSITRRNVGTSTNLYVNIGTDPAIDNIVSFINAQEGFSASHNATSTLAGQSLPGLTAGTYDNSSAIFSTPSNISSIFGDYYQAGGEMIIEGNNINSSTNFILEFTTAGTPYNQSFTVADNPSKSITIKFPEHSSPKTIRGIDEDNKVIEINIGTEPSVQSIVDFINSQEGYSASHTATSTNSADLNNQLLPGLTAGTYEYSNFVEISPEAIIERWYFNNTGIEYNCSNILGHFKLNDLSGGVSNINLFFGSSFTSNSISEPILLGSWVPYTPTTTPSIVVNGASIPIYPEETSGLSLSSQLISNNFFSQTCSTLNLQTIQLMFYNCNSLKELNLEGLITENVINMSSAFSSCYRLRHINVCDSNNSTFNIPSELDNNSGTQETGQYTGDGSVNGTVVNLGYRPSQVYVYNTATVDAGLNCVYCGYMTIRDGDPIVGSKRYSSSNPSFEFTITANDLIITSNAGGYIEITDTGFIAYGIANDSVFNYLNQKYSYEVNMPVTNNIISNINYNDLNKGSFNSSNCINFNAMFSRSSMIRTFGSIRGTFNSAAFNFNNAEDISSMFSDTFKNVVLEFLTVTVDGYVSIELNSAEKIKGVLDAHLGFDSQELFDDFDMSSAADTGSPHTEPQYINPDSELITSALNPEFQIYPNGGRDDNYGAQSVPQNLAISDDGNTLFFLGRNRKTNENSSSTGYQYGMVYVFRRKSDGTFDPNAFNSPNEIITNLPNINIGLFGASWTPWDRLDVNTSGNVLIVSSPQYNVNDTSDRRGAALIFRYDESTSSWGDYTFIQGPHGGISKAGHDISIDDSGDTFIMSSQGGNSRFNRITYAAIFKYNSGTESWDQMNIEGESSSNPLIREDSDSNFYPRLSEMSGDGNLVVAGGHTQRNFRTYIYDNASSMWKQRGAQFTVGGSLSASQASTVRIRLSKDGNTLIAGRPRGATGNDSDLVLNDFIYIYKYSASINDWGTPFEIRLPASASTLNSQGGMDVGITGDGNRIFVSSLSKISIYDFDSSSDSWSLTGSISSNGLKTADGSPDSTGFNKNFVVTPDGSKLFTGSNGKSIVMYDVATSLSGETISDAFDWQDYRDYQTNSLDKISKNFVLNFTDRTSDEPIEMQSLFSGCNMLPHITILGNPNSIKVNNFSGAFGNCSALRDFLDLSALNFKECSSLSRSFLHCFYLKRIILPPSFLEANNSTLDTSSTFEDCYYLQDFPNGTSSWSGTSVVDMHSMFENCHLIKNLDLSSFNPSLCEKMHFLFSGCYSLEILNLKNFNTKSCNNFNFMFDKVGKPPNLDLSIEEHCQQANRSKILISDYATNDDGVIYDYDRNGINASVFTDLQFILDSSDVDSTTYLQFIADNLTPQVRYYLHYSKEIEEFVQIWNTTAASSPEIIPSRAAPGLASIDLTSFNLESAVDSLDYRYWDFVFGSDVSQSSNARPNIRAVINPEDRQGRHHFFKLGPNNVISGINLEASLDLLKASDPPPNDFFHTSANITFPQSIAQMFSGISIDTLTIPDNFFINHKERVYRYLLSSDLSYLENPTNGQRVTIGASPNPTRMFHLARINKLNISNNFLKSLKYSTSFDSMFSRSSARDYRKVSLIDPSNSTPNTEHENLEELLGVNFYSQDAPIDTAGTDFSKLDTTNAVSMHDMFGNAHFTNFDTSKIKTDNVINMNYLFQGFDTSLNDLIINSMNTKNVFYMRSTFSYILNKKYTFNNEPLSEVDLSGLDLSSCVNMEGIFRYSDIDAFILPTNRMLFPAENSNQLNFINFNNFTRSVNSFNNQKNLQPRINKINTFLGNIAKSGIRQTNQYGSRIYNARDALSFIDNSSVLFNIYSSRQAYAIHENPLDFHANSEIESIGDSVTIWQDISSASLTINFHNLDLFPTNMQEHSAAYFFQGNSYISSIINLSILDFDIRDYTSSSASDFDFRYAFRDNLSLKLDLSSWCVNSISSAPVQFANSSPNITSPNWGEPCN